MHNCCWGAIQISVGFSLFSVHFRFSFSLIIQIDWQSIVSRTYTCHRGDRLSIFSLLVYTVPSTLTIQLIVRITYRAQLVHCKKDTIGHTVPKTSPSVDCLVKSTTDPSTTFLVWNRSVCHKSYAFKTGYLDWVKAIPLEFHLENPTLSRCLIHSVWQLPRQDCAFLDLREDNFQSYQDLLSYIHWLIEVCLVHSARIWNKVFISC